MNNKIKQLISINKAQFLLQNKIKNLSQNFEKILQGFHCVSKEPLKESRWEEINTEIIQESGYIINHISAGSHKSGCDISCEFGNLSNKTGIIDKKNNGNIENIISEIHKRNCTFDFYLLLARNELKDKKNKKNKI